MRKGRIDYRMQRRATLGAVAAGRRSREDVCDAHPDLLRAGTHIGTPVAESCPVCDADELRHVHYVFDGRTPKSQGGRAVPRENLTRQQERYGDLDVYTVEVCVLCHWHHLVESFLLLARDPDSATSG
ncbi:DUF5318 family protein [Egicoccus halophilus]|uniref:DUF5318 domain-containing protein n=1 Tax=Egicoccus halophilus TaxID=1670830 RepID=A0A8J3EQS4_9ACTN|nr:DUF5318 family protein [Egicoccus halophilus]GGI03215.1 hypothetical protein GCM10011354_03010 [Egicoccus halophilus]